VVREKLGNRQVFQNEGKPPREPPQITRRKINGGGGEKKNSSSTDGKRGKDGRVSMSYATKGRGKGGGGGGKGMGRERGKTLNEYCDFPDRDATEK